MGKVISVVVVAVALLSVSACEVGRTDESPPPDVRPVADSAPYLCDLVPESAFRDVTGLTAQLNSDWNGPQTDNGLCSARPESEPFAPLGVRWSYNEGTRILQTQQENWADLSHQPLPPELGKGLAGHHRSSGPTGRPNYVIALFRCGEKRPWISIAFVSAVRGRDVVQDMFDFMRIAQQRFGEIHECTPRP
ncbi:hypothetical protein ACN3XK_55880 [Actinomadura welshii]